MKTAALIANGQIDSPEIIRPLILKHEKIVAVDGGLHHARAMGIDPALIVGDFDSCSPDILAHYPTVPKLTLPCDKDTTDLEVAIEHIFKEGFDKITLYGAWGHRLDHSLTNALFLARHPEKLRLETETDLLFAITRKSQLRCQKGQTLSLIPIYGPATGITTNGLKWELNKGKLDGRFVGISNICLKEMIEIDIEHGALLCCLLKNSH